MLPNQTPKVKRPYEKPRILWDEPFAPLPIMVEPEQPTGTGDTKEISARTEEREDDENSA